MSRARTALVFVFLLAAWGFSGLLASAARKTSIAKIRMLLGAEPAAQEEPSTAEVVPLTLREPCPDCGGPMHIIEIFRRGQKPMSRAPPRKQAA